MILNPKIKVAKWFQGPEWESTDAETYRQQARARYMKEYANRPIKAPSEDATTSLKRKANQMDHDGEGEPRDNGADYDQSIDVGSN